MAASLPQRQYPGTGGEPVKRHGGALRKVTAGGVITYQSDRARGSNHGDLAWATMQGIYNEPIGAEVTGDNGSFVEEF